MSKDNYIELLMNAKGGIQVISSKKHISRGMLERIILETLNEAKITGMSCKKQDAGLTITFNNNVKIKFRDLNIINEKYPKLYDRIRNVSKKQAFKDIERKFNNKKIKISLGKIVASVTAMTLVMSAAIYSNKNKSNNEPAKTEIENIADLTDSFKDNLIDALEINIQAEELIEEETIEVEILDDKVEFLNLDLDNEGEEVIINLEEYVAYVNAESGKTYTYLGDDEYRNNVDSMEIAQIVYEVAPTWGLDPNLILAMTTQESKGENITDGAAIGPMQIEKTNAGQYIMALNHDTGEYETILLIDDSMSQEDINKLVEDRKTDYPGRPVTDTVNINQLSTDMELHYKIACMFYQAEIERIYSSTGEYDIIKAIVAYNMGYTNFKTILANTPAGEIFLVHTASAGVGDPFYLINVLQYLKAVDNDHFEITYTPYGKDPIKFIININDLTFWEGISISQDSEKENYYSQDVEYNTKGR